MKNKARVDFILAWHRGRLSLWRGPPRVERTMHVQVHSDAMALLLILPSLVPIILGTICMWPGSDSTIRISGKDENE